MKNMNMNMNMNMKNYYDILNVSKDATDVEIKRAFRRLSLELHPDKNDGTNDNGNNETRYKQVIEAYSILGDSEKRNEYNKTYIENRLTRSRGNINAYSNSSVNSRNYFDREPYYTNKNRNNHNHNYYSRNRNISNISNINDMNDMNDNDGYDSFSNSDHSDDENIDNRNTYNRKRSYDYQDAQLQPVYNHNNRLITNSNINANINKNRTPNVNLEDIRINRVITLEESYTGVSAPLNIKRTVNDVEEADVVYVDIPEGTDDGEIIILEGKGNIKNNYRSNIRVKVNVEQHLHFKRDKMNLIYNVDISLKEALCGFKREVTHLNGKQYMIGSERGKIVQQNSRRCIPNKGFQRGQNIGNLIINFNIVMPRSLSDEQISILEKTLNN